MGTDNIVQGIVADFVAASGNKEEYQKFFDEKLKKHGVKSPSELSDADKKKFFNEVDEEWEADTEED